MNKINHSQGSRRIQDTITVGLLGGVVGTVLMEISNLIIFKAGKTETLYGHIAGSLLVSPFKTKQKNYFILGEITHFVIGSLWGILLAYILKKSGRDHYLLKGVVVSSLSLGTIIAGQKTGTIKKFGLSKTFYSAAWNHLIYGLASAQTIVSLTKPSILSNKTKTSANVEINGCQYSER